ncbi:unnamed protein product [Penicillium salamii]|uniref:Uncharacterized protein n=1 Tax=Penicillium salamii TaxID=1612424 RepID=A0A9W4I718_9EURO|nr:unnamed protein product [Penicillium salamii]
MKVTKRLYFLDLGISSYPRRNGRIMSCTPEGTDFRELVTGLQTLPDGIAIDFENNHIYWTNIGESMVHDGSIHQCDLSGKNITTIIPSGVTHTPKQLKISQNKIYWCDREGMRVMRAKLDGSSIETLYCAGRSDEDREDRQRWCVGIAVDEVRGKLYWSQKGPSKGGLGHIMCMDLNQVDKKGSDVPADFSKADVHVVLDHLPEPIGLELDTVSNTLYWTDRDDPPFGNSVNAVNLEAVSKAGHMALRLLVQRLHEGIGLSLDLENGRMFFGDLMGGVYVSRLDGTEKKTLFTDLGDITGLEYVNC